jgi:hypothetical protein
MNQVQHHLKRQAGAINIPARFHLFMLKTLAKILGCLARKFSIGLAHHGKVVGVTATQGRMIAVAAIINGGDPVGIKLNRHRIANFHGIKGKFTDFAANAMQIGKV